MTTNKLLRSNGVHGAMSKYQREQQGGWAGSQKSISAHNALKNASESLVSYHLKHWKMNRVLIFNKWFQALVFKRLEADIRDERDSRHGLLKIFLISSSRWFPNWHILLPIHSTTSWYENSHISLQEFNIEVIYYTV